MRRKVCLPCNGLRDIPFAHCVDLTLCLGQDHVRAQLLQQFKIESIDTQGLQSRTVWFGLVHPLMHLGVNLSTSGIDIDLHYAHDRQRLNLWWVIALRHMREVGVEV